MKNAIAVMFLSLAGTWGFAAPTVTSVQVDEDLANNRVTVTYRISDV